MNLIIGLASFIALCAGNAVPSIPRGDNGDQDVPTRYIWMADDNGVTHLVDLQEPVNTDLQMDLNNNGNQYWLFTRSNPSPQLIVQGNENSVKSSNYNNKKPLKVVVHGWHGYLTNELNTEITSALLAVSDVNVIVVDWSTVAASSYLVAAANTPAVGQEIGNFVEWLINNFNGNWDNVHLIGFSLGAHAVGSAGRVANGRPIRVTGLDPAGPGWNLNENALNVTAGRYVEVIHTDIGVMGILPPIGHVDFYPNGGVMQPGCNSNQCSHSRAWALFASSVRTNHFTGRKCSNFQQALDINCSGSTRQMGNSILKKQGTGIYGLRTGATWPF